MKRKKPPKLMIRRDTVRQLADLDLRRAAGGGPAAIALDTGEASCPFPAGIPLSLKCAG